MRIITDECFYAPLLKILERRAKSGLGPLPAERELVIATRDDLIDFAAEQALEESRANFAFLRARMDNAFRRIERQIDAARGISSSDWIEPLFRRPGTPGDEA